MNHSVHSLCSCLNAFVAHRRAAISARGGEEERERERERERDGETRCHLTTTSSVCHLETAAGDATRVHSFSVHLHDVQCAHRSRAQLYSKEMHFIMCVCMCARERSACVCVVVIRAEKLDSVRAKVRKVPTPTLASLASVSLALTGYHLRESGCASCLASNASVRVRIRRARHRPQQSWQT